MPLTNAPVHQLEQPFVEQQAGRDTLRGRAIYRVALAYGRFLYRFRWLILALWLVIFAVSVSFMLQTVNLLGGGDISVSRSDSAQVDTLLKQQFHRSSSQVLIALQASSVQVADPGYQQEISSLEARLRALPQVASVTLNPQSGADGKTTMLVAESRPNVDLPISTLRHLLATTNGPAKAYLTGDPAITNDIVTISLSDVEHADLVALPIALLILVVVFGTFVAACMPLLLAIVAVPVAFALLYPIAVHTQISTYVLSVASIVGLGIAIDYSLFIIRRYREELALGLSRAEAIGWTLATAGEAILFSGLIVMMGFVALLLIGIPITTSVGLGGIFIVFAAVLGALTFLPALLCILGTRINALRVPYLWRITMSADGQTGQSGGHGKQEQFWRGLALSVTRRPVLTVLLVCAILIALGWPAFSFRIGATGVASLPSSAESRQGLDILQAQYPALRDQTIDLIVQTRDHSSVLSRDNLQRLGTLTDWLKAQAHVTGVTSLVQLPASPGTPPLTQEQLIALYTSGMYQQNAGLAQFVAQNSAGNMSYIAVSSNAGLDSSAGNSQIEFLRQHLASVVPGFNVLVGGNQAGDLDFEHALFARFPIAIGFLLVTTFLLLTLMFRSLFIPLKAVVMNVVSVSAAYGVLVFIFQWGNFSAFLNFTSPGYVDDLIPIVLFCVLFGLSMDYEVFLLSRIREEWLRTGNNLQAVICGLEKTGSVITNAALLFLVVTVSFTFTNQLDIKEMGVGMTVAILVDATIIRSLLVPATMRLLGRWNWWLPGRAVPSEQTLDETVEAF